MTSIRIANAERIVGLAYADTLKPPPPVDYRAWAVDNIVFTKRESSMPGPYNPRSFPLFAYGGADDEEVQHANLEPWSQETSAGFHLRTFPGGHFFIDTARDAVLGALREDLGKLFGASP